MPDIIAAQDSLVNYLRHAATADLHRLFSAEGDWNKAAIYRNGYLRSCREALEKTYPAVLRVLGNTQFRNIAHQYIADHPAQERHLTYFGKHFPQWILSNKTLSNSVVLGELASLDWAWLCCLFDHDASPIDNNGLQTLLAESPDLADCALTPLRNHRILRLRSITLSQWEALRSEASYALPPSTLTAPLSEQIVLLWRPKMRVLMRELPPCEWLFLDTLKNTHSLALASQEALERDPSFPLAEFFADLLVTHTLELTQTQEIAP